MGSSQSIVNVKNQSLLRLLLSKAPPGKKATVSNIAKNSSSFSYQDLYESDQKNALMRQQTMQMEKILYQKGQTANQNQQGQTNAFKDVLNQKTAEMTSADESAQITVETSDPNAPVTQTDKNLQQAASIIKQLGLTSESFGVESMARDLAVFDLDFTALKGNPHDLADQISAKAKEMVEKFDAETDPTASDYDARRREISGASARLINGLHGAAGAVAQASVRIESTGASRPNVSVDGTIVDATAIIATANIIVDPLVFDMNGDGIDLKGAEEGVDFDMNGNGEQSRMGFIRGDDALLFIDQHGDGVVRDGRQLFGNTDGYANGFEKLRSYDDNGDGVIDENDAIYDQLRLWVEKTEDGVCEAEETMSLRDAGVKAINVGYENVREDDGKGNLIGQVGSFTREDGSAGTAADVWFQELARRR